MRNVTTHVNPQVAHIHGRYLYVIQNVSATCTRWRRVTPPSTQSGYADYAADVAAYTEQKLRPSEWGTRVQRASLTRPRTPPDTHDHVTRART